MRTFMDQLRLHMMAGSGVTMVRTRDSIGATNSVYAMGVAQKRPVRVWDAARGWHQGTDPVVAAGDGNVAILDAFRAVLSPETGDNLFPTDGVFVFNTAHLFISPDKPAPIIIDLLTIMVHKLPLERRRVVIMAPMGYSLPLELSELIPVVEDDVPDTAALMEAAGNVLEDCATVVRGKLPKFSKEELSRLAQAGAGMIMPEFENALSRVVMDQGGKRRAELTTEGIRRAMLQEKAEMVRRTNCLAVMDPVSMDQVGGLDLLKAWMATRVNAMDPAAWEAGVDKPKGVALVGPPGCLSGETVLSYRRGIRNSGRDITLADFYAKFNGHAAGSRGWDTSLPTYLHSHDAETGTVFYNRVVSVIDSGVKPVFLLTTEGGRQLRLTGDHPVLTEDGYVPAADLEPGQEIIVRGSMTPAPHPVRHGRKPRVVIEGLKYYSGGWNKSVTDHATENVYTYRRQHRARLVVEAQMNGMTYPEYLHRLKTDPAAMDLKALPGDMVVHHLDENPMNDAPGNLQIIFKSEHDRLHTDESNFNVEYTALDRVLMVEAHGVDQTYDIQMAAPCNNFATADGLLVHNTGKSLCAKVIGSVLGVATISFNISAVFQGLVGSSEANMRTALSMIKSLAPCVVLLDEMDKVFQTGGSGDSGVSQRVLGTLLTFMQENDRAIFWVPTMNRTENMPAEFLRAGRIDNVFGVGVPRLSERVEVLRIHLRKRKVNPDSLPDLQRLGELMDGFVSAEVEGVAVNARLLAYNEGVDVQERHLETAIAETRPLSRKMADQFAAMQQWCEQHATPASSKVDPMPAPGAEPARRRRRRIEEVTGEEVPPEAKKHLH